MPTDELISDMADVFKLYGDTTRLKILYALLEQELSVTAIAEKIGMTQSAISHQLKVLRDANLIAPRRDGKVIYYSPADDHVRTIIEMGYEHIIEEREENKNEEDI